MIFFNYFVWDPNPEIFPELIIDWEISPMYYGLMFALGFLFGQQIIFYIFKKEGKPKRDVDTLTILLVVFSLTGARLGHVFFYEPEVYLPNPIDILKFWRGGLSSHGAVIGVVIGLLVYLNYFVDVQVKKKFPFIQHKTTKRKREAQSFFWISDRVVIVAALIGCFIRVGNFISSEMYGIPTNAPWGVVFARVTEESIMSNPAIESAEAVKGGKKIPEGDFQRPVTIIVNFKQEDFPESGIRNYLETEVKTILSSYPAVTTHFYEHPTKTLRYNLRRFGENSFQARIETLGISRHATQLYEATSYFILFLVLLFIWKKKKSKTTDGQMLGIFLVGVFSLRFIIEFLKVNQVGFEENIPLNMGQWLSIPLILTGLYLLIKIRSKKSTVPQGTGS